MLLVGATDNDSKLVLHLGDDATGATLFTVKMTPDRVVSLISQMEAILKILVTPQDIPIAENNSAPTSEELEKLLSKSFNTYSEKNSNISTMDKL